MLGNGGALHRATPRPDLASPRLPTADVATLQMRTAAPPMSSSSSSSASTTTTTTTPPPAAPATAPAARNRKDHTPAEWDAVRGRIAELYLDKRLRLADVSRILREEDDFHATDKQFKDRIRKWGLRKNFTNEEKRKAIAEEWNAHSDAQPAATDAALIPKGRLRRFARDEKLLYIRRMAVGASLPPEPEAIFDFVIELPRSIFERTPGVGPPAIHEALAAVDRQMRARCPILAMDVLGVSDATVRYGMKRVQKKASPGSEFELLPPSNTPGREHGMGIRYCASLASLKSIYGEEEGDEHHLSLFHTVIARCYFAFQTIWAPETRIRNALIGGRTGAPPGLQCVRYNASVMATQVLYLRLLGHAALASSVRYVGQMGDAEMVGTPEDGLSYRIDISETAIAYMTVKPATHMDMHIVKTGDVLAGVTRFSRGYEAAPVFMGGNLDHESAKMNLLANPSEEPPAAPTMGPFLTEEASALDSEFQEASKRAAQKAAERSGPKIDVVVVDPTQSPTGVLPRPQRDFIKAATNDYIVDRNAPWKLAV